MRNLAPFLIAVSAVVALTAMDRPPVEQLVEGQAKCGNDICIGSKTSAVHVKGPLYLENTSGLAAIQLDGGINSTNNALNASTKGLVIYDFPALTAASQCVTSTATATIANCPFGSALSTGVDQVMNTTDCLPPAGVLTAANTVAVQLCVVATDGGTCNMPDASYIVRCTP